MSRDEYKNSEQHLTDNKTAREERRAQALRANLRRRKLQTRARAEGAKGSVVEDKPL